MHHQAAPPAGCWTPLGAESGSWQVLASRESGRRAREGLHAGRGPATCKSEIVASDPRMSIRSTSMNTSTTEYYVPTARTRHQAAAARSWSRGRCYVLVVLRTHIDGDSDACRAGAAHCGGAPARRRHTSAHIACSRCATTARSAGAGDGGGAGAGGCSCGDCG